MKKYFHDSIEAEPMTYGDYYEFRKLTIPYNENPLLEGYIIKFTEYDYSWLPKKTFEERYKPFIIDDNDYPLHPG